MALTQMLKETKKAKEKESETDKLSCSKCYIKLKDVKLANNHFWRVHVNVSDQLNAITCLKTNKPLKITPSMDSPIVPKSNTKPAKRLNTTNTIVLPSKTTPSPKEKKTIVDTRLYPCDIDLTSLSRDEIRYFNFLKKELNEVKIAERVQNLSSNINSKDKLSHFKPGTIGWAKWSRKGSLNIMWPCVIEKVQENKKAPPKVWIRYYEYSVNQNIGHIFKLDLECVELFFRNTREHFESKITTCTDPGTKCRYEFFYTYTNALKDFETKLQILEKEKVDSVELPENHQSKKYRVNNDMLSLSEIQDNVNRDLSKEQQAINQKRIDESREIMNVIISKKEIKDFLVSIMTTKSDKRRLSAKLEPHLVRHLEYLNGCSSERSKIGIDKMGLGPVTHDDCMAICQYLQDICKKHYKTKPKHLKNYEIDVLYYEAVIWALMKSKSIKRKQACNMYEKNIFNYTSEEKLKSLCHDILNRVNQAETTDPSSKASEHEDIDDMFDAIYDIRSVNGDSFQELDQESQCNEEVFIVMTSMLDQLKEIM